MDFGQMMNLMQNPNGLSSIMLEDAFEDEETGHTFSQAELIADVVNILRMDTKRLGQALGVPVEINRMTPERAAELLQGVAMGNDMGLIQIFDEIEDQRQQILAEVESEDDADEWMEQKKSMLYTYGDEADADDASEE